MPSPSNRVERAQPLLGTQVAIRIDGLPAAKAHRRIDIGFDAIAAVHRLMSFHESASDVGRLNRAAATKTVAVDPQTFAVVARGLEIAAASGGAFDMTVAKRLVTWGFLPDPKSKQHPHPRASWRDIELIGDSRIRFHRPLWIDLGGIAKGYAVDQAFARMDLAPNIQCCVNAGGDLRISGPVTERVLLRLPWPTDAVPLVELEGASLASSSGREHIKRYRGQNVGPHVKAGDGKTMGLTSFASVVAAECMTADALTKVVLAKGMRAAPVLRHFGAVAYFYHTRNGWRTVGEGEA